MKEIHTIKTITEVHDFLGLPKPKHPLVSVVYHQDGWENIDFEGKKYAFALYQVTLKNFKAGSFVYGRNTYDFQEGTMVFTGPNQVMEFSNHTESTSTEDPGWTLLFHPDFIRKSSLGASIEDYSFFNYEVYEALHLSDDEKKSLTEQIQKIETEYRHTIDKHSQELIIANIELLLKYCKRFYDRQFYTRANLNKDLITEFHKIIKGYYGTNRPLVEGVLTVRECAETLHMSVNYLGDLIKTETGRNAKDHIQEYMVEKAKTQLLGTNQPIKQIAYGLGFEYPQGFNKLFKAKMGVSPSAYRNLN